LNLFVKGDAVDLLQELLKSTSVFELSGQGWEGLEAVSRMVVGCSAVLNAQLAQNLCVLRHMVGW
jgi:hypothetical protein